MNYCWKDGKITKAEDTTVGVRDIGMLRGYGIYDGITVIKNKPFRIADHLARFHNSAAGLALKVPYSDEEITQAIIDLSKNYKDDRCIIRLILTGGVLFNGIEFNPETPTFYILSEPHVPLAQHYYETGVKVITHENQRQYPAWKTIDYITAVKLNPQKKAAGALEIIFTSNGHVLECSTSNIGIVLDGTLVFPKEGALEGITRKVAIELAKQNSMPVEERNVTITELFGADEVFLTSSFKDIVPIVDVDGKKIGQGTPGAVTKKLADLVEHYLQNA